MKVSRLDKVAYANAITNDSRFNASRIDMAECKTDDERHVHAAAVLISQLMILRTISDAKPLARADIQLAINAAMDGASIEEFRHMGAVAFRKMLKFEKVNKRKHHPYKNIKPGCHIKLNSQEDAIVWLVTEKEGNTLTIRERDYPRNKCQYTDVSMVVEVAK